MPVGQVSMHVSTPLITRHFSGQMLMQYHVFVILMAKGLAPKQFEQHWLGSLGVPVLL